MESFLVFEKKLNSLKKRERKNEVEKRAFQPFIAKKEIKVISDEEASLIIALFNCLCSWCEWEGWGYFLCEHKETHTGRFIGQLARFKFCS